MELWVRSQNKKVLMKIDGVHYDGKNDWRILNGGSVLGRYATEERCLEIIDEIQKLLLSANGDCLVKLQDIDVNAEVETIFGMEKLQNNRIMPIANEPSVQFRQPSVLVYEMPKE